MENLHRIFASRVLFLILSILIAFGFLIPIAVSADSSTIVVWWPTNGAQVSGMQPFKALVAGMDVSQYDMFWQVDGGSWNWMDNNNTDYPHKESSIDLSGWTWHGSGPYVVNFIARQGNTVIAQQPETIYVENGLPQQAAAVQQEATTTNAAPPTPAPVILNLVASSAQSAISSSAATSSASTSTTLTSSSPATSTPIQVPAASAQNAPSVATAATDLYVDPNSDAASQEAAWQGTNAQGTLAMATLAAQPTAVWLGNWNTDVESDVSALVRSAANSGTVPVLVAYNIPERDCGGFSSGGADNPDGYGAWMDSVAAGIGNMKAIVILEPDAIAQIGCLSSADQQTRLQLLGNAVRLLKSNPGTKVYIDAGHSDWIDPETMAQELTQADIADADGFSLNVSNFMTTSDEIAYGESLSAKVGNKHFVIDTSRNGNGSNGQWCNPSDMAIGSLPTTSTGNPLVDAYLWIKTPGESDGTCNGGPAAGVWWPQYALELVQDAQ